jgi:hypothetical protein
VPRPGLVDRLVSQAEVGNGGNGVPAWNTVRDVGAPARLRGHLAPLLRGVVLIPQPALGMGLDLRSIGLARWAATPAPATAPLPSADAPEVFATRTELL